MCSLTKYELDEVRQGKVFLLSSWQLVIQSESGSLSGLQFLGRSSANRIHRWLVHFGKLDTFQSGQNNFYDLESIGPSAIVWY